MEKNVLNAVRRTVTGKKVGALRREGKLPGILYGHNIAATPILMDLREASRILPSLTASSLVSIHLDGAEHSVLVREKQRDFIRGTLLHVDFQVVSLTEKIRTNVNIILQGTSPAVKDFNGLVMTGLTELEVESFPQDLPERFVVDISNLANIGDGIYVRDIPTPANVEIFGNPDEMVVLIATSGVEEEEVVEAPAVEEPEVIEKGKKEEEDEE